MPLASNVLPTPPDTLPLREKDLSTACPICETSQRLAEASVDESDPLETVYTCRHLCGPILIVSTPGVVPWKGRGSRVGDWAIRNPRDLFISPRGKVGSVLIPAAPHALD